ncbi:acetylornithine deacetylase [Amaricoccus macauensis]|uniref:acetylornithine deacetylase n=1 Tax=Amaricoccus macauensis TaxID=57001 RepID=UPI003C7B0407
MQNRFSTRDMLARLVSFPTVSTRSNLGLIGFVDAYLASHGVPTWRVPDETGEKASLFARIGPDVPGGVVLSGHTDVVPTEGQDWSSDPWTLTEREGRLFGRGTCDMKGFCAASLAMVPEMLAANLQRPIIIALSHDEEIGCLKAPEMIDAILATLPRPEAVIVGEPSDMRVVTGHKGSWEFHGHARGYEVHSSLVHTGVSAISMAARMVNWTNEVMAENARNATDNAFVPPFTTLHVGVISGGTAKNITARDCSFIGEIRVMPDEDIGEWQKTMETEAARLEAEMRVIRPEASLTLESTITIPPLEPEADGPAERIARSLTGDNGTHVVSYQTEAGQFQEKGLSTVVCGPGSILQAHQPDEFITLSQLDAADDFMRRLIDHLAN